jgi:pimeloyl-ACP methyl ester carboxylesterase
LAGPPAGTKPLVYIAVVAPDAGETVQSQLDRHPSDIFSRVEVADGRAWMLPSGTEFFAGDLSPEEQKLVWAKHFAAADLFLQQKLSADGVAWKTKPSWYILATRDRTVRPDLQRHLATRMKALVTEVAGSHVPMLSRPEVVIDVVRQAAASLSKQARRGPAVPGPARGGPARRRVDNPPMPDAPRPHA